MDAHKLSIEIKKKAHELGFSHVGISHAQTLVEEKNHLQLWLEQKYHASMNYMSREVDKRTNLRLNLQEAESVISVAMNYYTTTEHATDQSVGKISRYAWGDDYHEIMFEKLHQLSSFIHELIPESLNKAYVDSGPMMDKAWAVRSGIGWLGKHSNVITRDIGSWIFLGEMITSIKLDYDLPIQDYCGTCTSCIDACPTDAIVQPYVVDSNKCISFHTIESKYDMIPDGIGEYFQNWIFGCDICQDVCPWNSFAIQTDEQGYYPRESNIQPELKELASLTKEEFSQRFKNSPIKRAKHKGLIRNVRNALREDASHKEQ